MRRAGKVHRLQAHSHRGSRRQTYSRIRPPRFQVPAKKDQPAPPKKAFSPPPFRRPANQPPRAQKPAPPHPHAPPPQERGQKDSESQDCQKSETKGCFPKNPPPRHCQITK